MITTSLFQEHLYKFLNEHVELKQHILGVYNQLPKYSKLPVIVVKDIESIDASSEGVKSKIFEFDLQVFTGKESSKACIELLDIIERIFTKKNFQNEYFNIPLMKILSSDIKFNKSKNIWIGAMKVKIWAETLDDINSYL